MKRWILAAALVTTTLYAGAQTKDVTGTWKINGDVMGVPVPETCVLTQKDAKVTGTCTMETGDYAVTGTFDGTTFSMEHGGLYNGDKLVLMFASKIAADGTMTGTIDVQPMNVGGTYTAAKVAAAK